MEKLFLISLIVLFSSSALALISYLITIAFTCCLVTLGLSVFLSFGTGLLNLGWIFDNFVPFITASIIFSYALAFYLYASSFGKGKMLTESGLFPEAHSSLV